MEKPQVGWGILTPDEEPTPETLEIIELLEAMPRGQVDFLLARCVSRYLDLELGLNGRQPDASQMVICSAALGNFFNDLLGRP